MKGSLQSEIVDKLCSLQGVEHPFRYGALASASSQEERNRQTGSG